MAEMIVFAADFRPKVSCFQCFLPDVGMNPAQAAHETQPQKHQIKDEKMNISNIRMNCSPSCAHKRGKILEPSDVLQLFKRSFGHVKDVKDVTDSDSFQILNKILVKPSSFSGLRCQEWPGRENLKFISTTSWSLELNLRAQFSASNI